ncbi:MAG: tetratricopeptide repeat protein [Magnetococcus sp. MYC-9]
MMSILQKALALYEAGQYPAALALMREEMAHNSGVSPEFLNLAGFCWMQLGAPERAITCWQLFLRVNPGHAETCYNLGKLLQSLQRWEEAALAYRTTLRLQPDHASACNNLGLLLNNLQQIEEAEALYRRALRLQPTHAGAHNNLGVLLHGLKRFEEAEDSFRLALRIQPKDAGVHYNLGTLLQERERFEEAVEAYQQAVTLGAAHEYARTNWGLCLFYMGMLEESLACLQAAWQDFPHSTWLIGSYSMVLLYVPSLDPARRHALRCQMVVGLPAPEGGPLPPRPPQPRPKRLAVVSSDFRDHPVARNVLPLLKYLNRQSFEIFFYAERLRVDDMTHQLQSLASVWHWTNDWSDQQLAQQMRKEQVDVVLFLAGHFDRNRIEVCRYRPAPLQISYHDAASSAFPEMDYFLTDTHLHPVGCKEPYSEKLYHLPVFYQYEPIVDAPDTGAPPLLERGHITFGSFNNPCKINNQVLDMWSRLLHAVPDSRLRLRYRHYYGSHALQRRILDGFAHRGVHPERIFLDQGNDTQHALLGYHGVDIALDTHPFTGATTTFEALWMGVPVVTLAGDSFVSRMTASLLYHGGLEQWVATHPIDWLTTIQQLAADRPALSLWRRILRDRLASSPLCQAQDYARSVEKGLLEMWQERLSSG